VCGTRVLVLLSASKRAPLVEYLSSGMHTVVS
jgi:hypothetical protein